MNAPTYLPYVLWLRAPAILPSRFYIPGRTIRGAVAERLRARGIRGSAAAFQALVRSDATRYLNAYPEVGGARSLPWPADGSLCTRQGKGTNAEGRFVVNVQGGTRPPSTPRSEFAESQTPAPDRCRDQGRQPLGRIYTIGGHAGGTERIRFIEAAGSPEGRRYAIPRTRTRSEGARESTPGPGPGWLLEALAPDQRFRGAMALWTEARAHIEGLKELLSGPILIGRSRRAGYGGLAEIRFEPEAAEEYPEVAGRLRDGLAPGDRFRALLTSAYLGRHPETGQLDPAALLRELAQRLGEAARIECRRWSFEAQAVAAGSVLLLRAEGTIGFETLRAIEHEGLGEGRRDGLGRLLFLAPPEPGGSTIPCESAQEPARTKGIDVAADEPQLAFLEKRIVLAAARAELERHATEDLAARARSLPDVVHLQQLRQRLDHARDERSAEVALGRLEACCAAARVPLALTDQLENCALPRGSLRDWLRKVAAGAGPPPRLNALVDLCCLTHPPAAAQVLKDHERGLRVHLIRALLVALERRGAKDAEVHDA